MLNYAVNISMIFADKPLRERLRLVAEAGFRAFEFWFPHQFDMDEMARYKEEFGLELALFDLEYDADYRHGHIASPEVADRFRQNLADAIALARRLECRHLNVLCGQVDPALEHDVQKDTMIQRLREAAPIAESEGIILTPEGINRVDRPRAFLATSRDGFDIVDAVGSPNVKFQYDIYHMQIMEGDLIRTIRDNISKIGHMQIADPPSRHEPGTGEVNFPNVLASVEDAGYDGWMSLEFNPSPTCTDPFAWMKSLPR